MGACFTSWEDRKKANVAEAERSRGVAAVRWVRSGFVRALGGLQALARGLDFILSTAEAIEGFQQKRGAIGLIFK